MSHKERISLIMKPFPTFNIVKSSYCNAGAGPSWSSGTISECSLDKAGFNQGTVKKHFR